MPPSAAPPFPPEHQLSAELDEPSPTALPGYPCVSLEDRQRLWDFLDKEFWAEDLDRIANRLWWMPKQDGGNISPLHRQSVKRRTIVVTEDPKLHLVWIHDRVFVKPLPRYIGSHAFWRDYLCSEDDAQSNGRQARIRKAALGYVRTYHHLVRYESDFRIAQDPSLCLIPAGVTWQQFCQFTSDLATIADRDVALRYTFGEIRLTRLNFYAPFLLGKSHFQRVEYQYGAYFARFYAPVLFLIGVTSIIISSPHLTVAVRKDQVEDLRAVPTVAFWFSITVILKFVSLLIALGFLLVYKVAMEWDYAIRDRLRLLEERRATAE